MNNSYKEYRNTNKVVPPLDFIEIKKSHPNARIDEYQDITVPEIVYSRWCRSNNIGMTGKAIITAVVNLGRAIAKAVFSIGAGASLLEAGHYSKGKTIDFSKPSKDIVPKIAELICKTEEEYWNRFYFLQTFEPFRGYLGEEKSGKSDDNGYVGYKITSDGTYLEGYFGNDMIFRGVRISPDGERFLGTIDLQSGFFSDCIVIKPDGKRKYGIFLNGEMTQGLYETNECAYYGTWKNGLLYEGHFLDNDDTGFSGNWENGLPVK